MSAVPSCPTCGKDLEYIAQYDRWYCYSEGKYAPKGFAAAPEAPAIALGSPEDHAGHYHCPSCGRELSFVSQYDRYYCYAEGKYAPRDIQPVGAASATEPAQTQGAAPEVEAVAEEPIAVEPAAESPAETPAVTPSEAPAESPTSIAEPEPAPTMAVERPAEEAPPEGQSPEEAQGPPIAGEPASVETPTPEPVVTEAPHEPERKKKPKGPRLTRASVMKAKKAKLMEWCSAYDLSPVGTRIELRDRLLAFMAEHRIEAGDVAIVEARIPEATPALETPPTEPVVEPAPEPIPPAESTPERIPEPEPWAEPRTEDLAPEPEPPQPKPAQPLPPESPFAEPESPPEPSPEPSQESAPEPEPQPEPQPEPEHAPEPSWSAYAEPAAIEPPRAEPAPVEPPKAEPRPFPPAPTPEPTKVEIEKPLPCPKCGKDLTYIAQYDRLYCYSCGNYAPRGYETWAKEGAKREAEGPTPAVSVVEVPKPVEAPQPVPAPVPVTPPKVERKAEHPCPTCGREMRYIRDYDRWWCDHEKKYAPRARNACPTCGKDLTYIQQYDRWYCVAEGKYAPRTYVPAVPAVTVTVTKPAMAAVPARDYSAPIASLEQKVAVIEQGKHVHGGAGAGIGLAAIGFSLFIVWFMLLPGIGPLAILGVFDSTTLGLQVFQIITLLAFVGLVLAMAGVIAGLAGVRRRAAP